MEEAQDVEVPEFLSTHPSPASRIEEFRVLMPEAMALYREAEASRAQRVNDGTR
jgi:predicted Zn-dependent protease